MEENKPDVVDEYSPQVVHDTDFSCGKKKVIQYLIWTNILLLYNLKTWGTSSIIFLYPAIDCPSTAWCESLKPLVM